MAIYNNMSLVFVTKCDQQVLLESTIEEGMKLTTSELQGEKSFLTYLTIDDAANLILCLQKMIEHAKGN